MTLLKILTGGNYMNQKKVKQLRKILKGAIASSFATSGELPAQVKYVESELNRKYSYEEQKDGSKHPVMIAPGTMKIASNSERGLYLSLKKNFDGQIRQAVTA